jgi:hypothetical protein
MTIHAEGPHVMAKAEMLRQMKAIIAFTDSLPVSVSAFLPEVTPMMPTMYWAMNMKLPPARRMFLRPNFSTI